MSGMFQRSLLDHVKLHSKTIRFKKPRKVLNKRKDKGIAKLSIAADLANVSVSLENHEKLVSKNTVDTDDSISDASAVSEVIYFPLSTSSSTLGTTSRDLDSLSNAAQSTQDVPEPYST